MTISVARMGLIPTLCGAIICCSLASCTTVVTRVQSPDGLIAVEAGSMSPDLSGSVLMVLHVYDATVTGHRDGQVFLSFSDCDECISLNPPQPGNSLGHLDHPSRNGQMPEGLLDLDVVENTLKLIPAALVREINDSGSPHHDAAVELAREMLGGGRPIRGAVGSWQIRGPMTLTPEDREALARSLY